ncbi:unnamed protein product [Diplocarpon coronariae]|uniref:CBN-OCR-3 protein n=1 Tax=Diplocarpon coronariae TaxID=2795749 RepID=A0A218Z214_9HELO|nr:hypothetical protein JHW43_008256 [Diplocarpon mali]OWP02121.1 CBN-OCR-3 protein [Marssonina coronariae]
MPQPRPPRRPFLPGEQRSLLRLISLSDAAWLKGRRSFTYRELTDQMNQIIRAAYAVNHPEWLFEVQDIVREVREDRARYGRRYEVGQEVMGEDGLGPPELL